MRIALFAATLALAPQAMGQEKFARTLKQERMNLKGTWQSGDWSRGIAGGSGCQAAIDIDRLDSPQILLEVKFANGCSKESIGLSTELKEKGGRRWFVVDPKYAKKFDFPTEIYYRLDGSTLILKIESGRWKDEYKLARVKKKDSR